MTDPWLRDVPAVFRALADPRLESAIPRPATGPLEQACAHWGALHYTLSSLLGWADVGRGLAWWYAAGKPVDDSPVLVLVQRVWGADDLIDYYAAWSWLPPGVGYALPQSAVIDGGPSPTWLAQHSRWPDEDWWRSFVRRGQVHHHARRVLGVLELGRQVVARGEEQLAVHAVVGHGLALGTLD